MDTLHFAGDCPVTYTLEFQVYDVEEVWELNGDDGTLRCFGSRAEALRFILARELYVLERSATGIVGYL